MIYTIVKPLDKTTTEVYIEIIEYLSKIGIRTVIGDAAVTTKKVLKRCKELGITYIGRIKKNWKTELFGDTEKIEKLFEKDLDNNKFKLRTIN
ncbi:transposase [Methanocaldococcus sp. 28A]